MGREGTALRYMHSFPFFGAEYMWEEDRCLMGVAADFPPPFLHNWVRDVCGNALCGATQKREKILLYPIRASLVSPGKKYADVFRDRKDQ